MGLSGVNCPDELTRVVACKHVRYGEMERLMQPSKYPALLNLSAISRCNLACHAIGLQKHTCCYSACGLTTTIASNWLTGTLSASRISLGAG